MRQRYGPRGLPQPARPLVMGMAAVSTSSVAAIIVTHNRLSFLKSCVAALRAQTLPPTVIIVVDNDSTDGTRDWLAGESDLRVILQGNLGGAGGFYTGMKTGFDQGYDWLWCMDDDGLPAPDCLERLVAINSPNLWYRAPLVLDRDDHETLAFPLRLPDGRPPLTTRTEAVAAATDGLLAGVACPFNGVLLHHRLYETIGFPLRQMFMWGDEMEFTFRANRAGIIHTTCIQAIHYHPRDRMNFRRFRFLGRPLSVAHIGNPLRDYLVVRNQAYINRVYFGWWRGIKHTGRYTVFYLMEYGVAAALGACRAGVAGMLGILTGHKKFPIKKA